MKKVSVLFVSATHDGQLILKLMGKLVSTVTGFRYAHSAIYILNGCFEAIAPQVMLSPLDKYNKEEEKECIEVTLTEKGYAKLLSEAKKIIGEDVKYGIVDCILTGIADIFSYRLAKRLYYFFPTKRTNHCSGIVSRLLIHGGVKELAGYEDELVSPMRLFTILKMRESLLTTEEKEPV